MTLVLSIGHSTLDYEKFAARLKTAGVTAIADVRTSPFSRNFAHFNRDVLKDALAHDGIAYVFLGKELGGRPKGEEYYTDGIADYEKMAKSDLFQKGLERVEQGARKYRIAMMCSERSPLECHRCLLVGRALAERSVTVSHLLHDGEPVAQSEIEEQLLAMAGKQEDDMFASPAERLNDAYRERARKVAFAEASSPPGAVAAE
jgi:uncharacterized protein (DUF488 family)